MASNMHIIHVRNELNALCWEVKRGRGERDETSVLVMVQVQEVSRGEKTRAKEASPTYIYMNKH